jgi:hypothetical protein
MAAQALFSAVRCGSSPAVKRCERNPGVACALFPLLAGAETREGRAYAIHISHWEAFDGEP